MMLRVFFNLNDSVIPFGKAFEFCFALMAGSRAQGPEQEPACPSALTCTGKPHIKQSR